MKFHFNDYPYYVPEKTYEIAIQDMTQKLMRQEEIVSIFQMGSILHPGISDIDMLVVFQKNGEFQYLNPLNGLTKTERYLFLHPLLGVSRTDFMEAQQFTFYRNWHLLYGEKLIVEGNDLPAEDIKCIQIQTALEYLLWNYISLTIKIKYGVFSVRAMLLNMKAMVYDLHLLGVSSGKLYQLLQTLIAWRNNWFNIPPNIKHLSDWILECHQELHLFLMSSLEIEKFYIPPWGTLQITKNATLVPSSHFYCTHRGIILPVVFECLGKKYLKIQRHLNHFFFYLPIQKDEIPPILNKKFELEYKMALFAQDKQFTPLKSTLNYLRKIHTREL
jgi:hypothetical protein